MKLVNFLNSKGTSLFCFFLNCAFTFSAYIAGELMWFMLSSALAILCFWNYQGALIKEKEEKTNRNALLAKKGGKDERSKRN